MALDDIDDALADTHAMRLLVDRQATKRANEATLTAVRVLQTRGHWMPLYLYAMLEADNPIVVSECLRRLTSTRNAHGRQLEMPTGEASGQAVGRVAVDQK